MSVLSVTEIIDRIYVADALDPSRIFIVPAPRRESIKDASLDLMLGNHFIVTKSARFSCLEPCGDETRKDVAQYQERVLVPFGKKLMLHPGSFILGVSWQYIGLPKNIHAQVSSRSTWGRAGLTVATAVVVHPSFSGCITLELVNNGNAPIALHPGARLAQIIFMHVKPDNKTNATGNSKYFGMTEPGFTRLHDERPELDRWKQIGKYVSFQTNSEP